jgi:hypothetical protein
MGGWVEILSTTFGLQVCVIRGGGHENRGKPMEVNRSRPIFNGD